MPRDLGLGHTVIPVQDSWTARLTPGKRGTQPLTMLSAAESQRSSSIPGLVKAEIRRGLRISTWEGAFGQIHAALTANALLTGFALS